MLKPDSELQKMKNILFGLELEYQLKKQCSSHKETGEYCKNCGEQVIAANPDLTGQIFWNPTIASC